MIGKLEKYFVDKYECGSVKISNNVGWDHDLELSEWNTADGYELYVMTNDAKNIDWENDVYYYEPSFNMIIDRIEETIQDVGYDIKIHMNVEQFLPEQEVIEWLEQKED